MSKSNQFETDFLELIFNAVAIANIADNASASPATTLDIALHTADPGEAGDQSTNEADYTSYTRVTVARTAGGWTITGGTANPVATISFPAATGGSNTITHFSVGSGVSNNMMYSGVVSPNIVVTSGVTPQLSTATSVNEE